MSAPRNYPGLEGLRGILAWIVVLSHIVQQTGLNERLPGYWTLTKSGDQAVSLFIIISGFVITHLVLCKAEPWPAYILRRAFRIFPAWLVCLAIAVAVQPIEFQFLTDLPWHENPHETNHLILQAREIEMGRGPLHLALHLTLLHGMVPDQILTQSIFIFLPPGWSLSLEWQFYLVAPFLIAALIRQPLLTFLVCASLTLLGKAGFFGNFALPSFLPLALMLFLIGIVTRLSFDRFADFQAFPLWLALIGAALPILKFDWSFLGGWIVIAAYMKTSPTAEDVSYARLARLLDSPLSRAIGDRSYSIYLVHWPCIAASIAFAISTLHLGPWGTFVFTLVAGTALTALLSDLIYRRVERPGMRLGRLLAERLQVAA